LEGGGLGVGRWDGKAHFHAARSKGREEGRQAVLVQGAGAEILGRGAVLEAGGAMERLGFGRY
jgi:hypothetical protein